MEEDSKKLTYCVYCNVGQDGRAADFLGQLGYHGISFQQVKRFFKGNRVTLRKTPLLPRYVFFEAPEACVPDWYAIKSAPSVQKILRYGDGDYAFRNEDLDFIAWMKKLGGLLDVSQVVRVGTQIRVIGGPLKHYEGKIVEVKKHRQMVAIEIGESGHFNKIWCPIEYIGTI